MRHYGALRRAMPVTFVTFAMGYLAIIGFPGVLGLLVEGQDHRGRARRQLDGRRCAPCSAPASPAFYMTRLMLMTFFSEKRWAEDVHPHESPRVMTVPLIVLAALSVLGGVLLLGGWIVDFLAPVVGTAPHEDLAAARAS